MRVHGLVVEEELNTCLPTQVLHSSIEEQILFQNFWVNFHKFNPVLKQEPVSRLFLWYSQFVPSAHHVYNAGTGIVHAILASEAKYENNESLFNYYFALSFNGVQYLYRSRKWTFETFIALSLLVRQTRL